MIASHYIVEIRDIHGELLYSGKVYSFDEAFWEITKLREKYANSATEFKIIIPITEVKNV